MSPYRNRNQSRQRSRAPLDRTMDKLLQTGKQVVDGVAGNRPGQRRGDWLEKANGPNFDRVSRWMGEKIDWFFEEEDDWLENEYQNDDQLIDDSINSKKPLGAISLRAPKSLPSRIENTRNNLDEINEWPDDESFKLNKWERKDNLIKQNQQDFKESSLGDQSTRKRNIPRSSRRKY